MRIKDIEFSEEFLRNVANRFGISQIALFGSILTPEFSDRSDLDFLMTFRPDSGTGLLEINGLKDELATHFHRRVDIVEKNALVNPYRRASILQNARVFYEA